MVRGKDVLNDATVEDAKYCGMDRVAEILSGGEAVAGMIYEMLPESYGKAVDKAGVIIAKGQGNYETMSGRGRHVFYEFLCKCDLFVNRFGVPGLTGMLPVYYHILKSMMAQVNCVRICYLLIFLRAGKRRFLLLLTI